MRIISGFKDYYDTVVVDGDPDVLFLRETSEIDSGNRREMPWLRSHQGVLFFCGKAFPFVVSRDKYAWSVDQYVSTLTEDERAYINSTHVSERSRLAHKIGKRYRWFDIFYLDKKRIDRFFGNKFDSRKIIDVHRKHESPIVMDVENHDRRPQCFTVVNPELKSIGFASIVDPYTAYQEIDMFMSNMFGTPAVEPRPVSDDIKRDLHGFDEWSFKQFKPGDKKRRRKENKAKKRGKS